MQRNNFECIAATLNRCTVNKIVIKIRGINVISFFEGRPGVRVMITLQQCADLIGLAPHEFELCALPSLRHKSLLGSYLMNLKRGEKAVCCMIINDFWRLMELGAKERAADTHLVLRLFLTEHPDGNCTA